MKCYMIFAGGGVKGAALVGALSGAEVAGIEPIGFGGCSAGAIVAVLAHAGYTSRELRQLLVQDDLGQFLGDEALRDLNKLKACIEAAVPAIQQGTVAMVWNARHLRELRDWYHRLNKTGGLSNGDAFRQKLFELLRAKLNLSEDVNDITFAQLQKLRPKQPLRVIVSDIVGQKALVYGTDISASMDVSVLDAVRASIGYPLMFEPVRMGSRLCADGGLCSNLPVFLFDDVRGSQQVPVLAVNLVPRVDTVPPSDSPNLLRLLERMLETALGGSDKLLRRNVQNLHVVEVVHDPLITAMSFDVSREDRQNMFKAGEAAVIAYHADFLKRTQEDKEQEIASKLAELRNINPDTVVDRELRTQISLQLGYGVPEADLQPILAIVAGMIEHGSNAENVRVHVSLPTLESTRIVVYQWNMDGASDQTLDIALYAGCTGFAVKQRQPVVADLVRARDKPQDWGMSPQQHARVPADRKAMLSVPLVFECNSDQPEGVELGTLSIDTSTALADVNWTRGDLDGNPEIRREILDPLLYWAGIIRRLLKA